MRMTYLALLAITVTLMIRDMGHSLTPTYCVPHSATLLTHTVTCFTLSYSYCPFSQYVDTHTDTCCQLPTHLCCKAVSFCTIIHVIVLRYQQYRWFKSLLFCFIIAAGFVILTNCYVQRYINRITHYARQILNKIIELEDQLPQFSS